MKRVLRSQSDFKSVTLRNQLTSLVLYEAITTTTHNAKNLESFANHFFNSVKRDDLAAKKLVHHTLLDQGAIKKTFEEIMPRYSKADTTFIRVLKATPRRGDSAPMSMVLLLKPLATERKAATPKPEVAKTKKVATKTKETK